MIAAFLPLLLSLPYPMPENAWTGQFRATAGQFLRAWDLHRAIAAQEDPGLLRAIWQVECTGKVVPACERSHKGACCEMQVLGGRHGNPSCEDLEASAWLCVVAADRQLERCWRMCGRSRTLGCFHSGGCETDGTYAAAVENKRQ